MVASGNSIIFPVDYLSSGQIAIQIIPTGGASVTVQITADDVNDPSYVTTWITPPAPFNVAITTNTLNSISLFPMRAIQFTVSVGGSAAITVLQYSGNDGVPGNDASI